MLDKCDGYNLRQILAVFFGCMASIANGMILSWTSPFLLVITRDKINYDVDANEAYLLTVIPFFGLIVSFLTCTWLTDNFGRKRILMIIVLPQISYWVITIFAKEIYAFGFARFLFGLGDGILFSTLPIYVAEIATPQIRGAFGNAITFFLFLGMLLTNITGSYFDVRTTALISVFLPPLFLILFSLMPESPYYHVMKGDFRKAEESLQWLRGKIDVTDELLQIKHDVQRQVSEQGRWMDLIVIESNRKSLFIGVFVHIFQQVAGSEAFVTYTQLIFDQAGGNWSPQLSSMILMTLFVISVGFSGAWADFFGRRKSFIASSILCGIFLLGEATYFYLGTSIEALGFVPLVGMIFWVISYSGGLGVVPTLLLGEIFSASVKPKGVCVVNLSFAVALGLTNYGFYAMNGEFGLYFPFAVFGVASLVGAVLAIWVVPETSGKTLEQIQMAMKAES